MSASRSGAAAEDLFLPQGDFDLGDVRNLVAAFLKVQSYLHDNRVAEGPLDGNSLRHRDATVQGGPRGRIRAKLHVLRDSRLHPERGQRPTRRSLVPCRKLDLLPICGPLDVLDIQAKERVLIDWRRRSSLETKDRRSVSL